jgi:hypothetical protein
MEDELEIPDPVKDALRQATEDKFTDTLTPILEHLAHGVRRGKLKSVHLYFGADGRVRVDVVDHEGTSYRPYATLDIFGRKFEVVGGPIKLPKAEDFFEDKGGTKAMSLRISSHHSRCFMCRVPVTAPATWQSLIGGSLQVLKDERNRPSQLG